jgi:hypothetical protein
MFKLNGFKIGAALLMLSSIANAAVIIDSQQIPSEDIVSITISPNSGNMFITTAVGYEVKPVGGVVTPPPPSDVSINTFTASPSTFVAGGSTTLSWTTVNATSCTPSGGNSDWAGRAINLANGSANIPLTVAGTYSFILTCQSSTGDTDAKNVTVQVTEEADPQGTTCDASPLGGTSVTWSNFWQGDYPYVGNASKNATVPRNGYIAFEFETSDAVSGSSSIVSVGNTITSGTRKISISECPGDFTVSNACKHTFGIGGGVGWSTTAASNTCLLQPNKTYYMNVTFTDGVDSTSSTCTSTYCQATLQYNYR